MKSRFESPKFIFKFLLLAVLLIVGWTFVNMNNLVKGKRSTEKETGADDLVGIDQASAEVPGGDGGSY